MISEIESDLIMLLKSFGIDKESTVATVTLAKTDENRQKMIDWIIERYDQKGKVTDEDVGKMLLFLIGERKKPSDTNSTRTEADTE